MRVFKLFVIGLCMGIADLIPGISGGTIAFLSGIYEDLLKSIQTIRIQGFKKIAWPFLLPLGSGIVVSFLSLTPLFSFLLNHEVYSTYTYAFFFGVILSSTLLFTKTVTFKKKWQWLVLALAALLVVLASSGQVSNAKEFSFGYLVFCGSLASSAMLLPGISGSYVLYLLGIYQLAIGALSNQTEIASLLLPLGIGIVLGLLVFSRVITFCLSKFRLLTMTALTGFMMGGLKEIWPFGTQDLILPISFAVTGFAIVWSIELLAKFKAAESRFKD